MASLATLLVEALLLSLKLMLSFSDGVLGSWLSLRFTLILRLALKMLSNDADLLVLAAMLSAASLASDLLTLVETASLKLLRLASLRLVLLEVSVLVDSFALRLVLKLWLALKLVLLLALMLKLSLSL